MKNLTIALTLVLSFALSHMYAQEHTQLDTTKAEELPILKFDFSWRFESLPYAPITGMTIGENPVLITIANLKINPTQTSISYWKSFDFLADGFRLIGDNSGAYDGIFVIQRLGEHFALKAIQFFDFSFEKNSSTLLVVQAKGGERFKWSLQGVNHIFLNRSPRQTLWNTFSYGQISMNNWIYYQFNELSWSAGIEWKSPKWQLFDGLDFQAKLVVNDTPSRRLGWSDEQSFGPNEVVVFGLQFFFN